MDVSVVVGNPKPQSRTLEVAQTVAARVAAATGATIGRTVDLADFADHLFAWPSDLMAGLNEAVAASDIAVIATPTYKAAYTGMLKAFLDRYPHNGLDGVIAIPIMTIASAHHALAVETTLRPLLVELGAIVPTRGLSFCTPQMDALDTVVDEWAEANLHRLTTVPERAAHRQMSP